jgi:hypothetical protein
VRTVPAFSPGDVVRFFRECGKEKGNFTTEAQSTQR